MKYALVLAAALALSSCGGQGDDNGSDAAATASPAAAPPRAAAPATPESRGRRLFNECAVCHTANEGESHRVGPNLFGVVGREAGEADGFAYSKTLTESDIVWTEENLDAYIENPQGFLPGNRMAYVGQRDAEKRADIIAYLKTLK